nr:hypothetical protein [Okeania sp. SIO2F4]
MKRKMSEKINLQLTSYQLERLKFCAYVMVFVSVSAISSSSF